jgi:hypothetical protein
MDGEMIEGRKVQVEASRGGNSKAQYPRGGRGGGYRVEAEGLDQRVSWQDLKDFAREVSFLLSLLLSLFSHHSSISLLSSLFSSLLFFQYTNSHASGR